MAIELKNSFPKKGDSSKFYNELLKTPFSVIFCAHFYRNIMANRVSPANRDFLDECMDILACGMCLVSTSTYCSLGVTSYRNGSENMDCLEILQRRIIGQLGYTALLATSIIETIARAILFLPALIITCNFKSFAITLTGAGAIISAGNIAFCLTALIRNIFVREIKDSAAEYIPSSIKI